MNRQTREDIENDARIELQDWTRRFTAMCAALKTSRIYLNVPFAEKDDAKKRGAWWDMGVKRWYVRGGHGLMNCWHWVPGETIDQYNATLPKKEEK